MCTFVSYFVLHLQWQRGITLRPRRPLSVTIWPTKRNSSLFSACRKVQKRWQKSRAKQIDAKTLLFKVMHPRVKINSELITFQNFKQMKVAIPCTCLGPYNQYSLLWSSDISSLSLAAVKSHHRLEICTSQWCQRYSKRGLFFQRWDRDFESALFWTGWAKLSLQYHFSTQNLMLYNFCLMVLSKFRHLATLAISPYGYLWLFWRFLARI